MAQSLVEKPFSKWRTRLWPIHSFELKKFLPLFFLKFLVSFNYTLLFTTKDTLVITAQGGGAEAIPVLKGWVVLPVSFLVMMIYTKMSNRLSHAKLFYTVLLPFLFFFLLFGFLLYPYQNLFCPHSFANWMEGVVGREHLHWVAVIRYWMHSLFYVIAELWGTVVIMLLFWNLANHINRIHEAKRFYSLFSVAGDLAPLIAGAIICSISIPHGSGHFASTLQKMMLLTSFNIGLIMALFWWIQRYVLTDTRFYSPEEQNRFKKERPKLSLRQSLRFILSSKYLGCIALLVIGYSLTLNLVEVTWKANLKLQYPDPESYQRFMGKFSMATGVVPLIAALFFSGNIMRKFGWFKSALIPPIVIGVTGVAFVFAFMNQQFLQPMTLFFGVTPLFLVVMLGAIQNVASKAVKYSLFDPTKEIAFIPLDSESKMKGKAAIDVVGSRLGKSGSSWIQAFLIDLFGMGSVLNITSLIAPIVVGVIFIWIFALHALNREFTQLTDAQKSAT